MNHRVSPAPKRRALLVPFLSVCSVAAVAACTRKPEAAVASPQAPGSAAAPATVLVEPPLEKPKAAVEPKAAKPKLEPALVVSEGISAPESALYDAEQDKYFVSSINGKPAEVDGNGFISKVSPDGKVLVLKFVDGTKKGSTLNAPKGLGVSGNLLYVADLDVVRLFDRKTGAPKGKIAVPGATFLNDIATGSDGSVYVSDSGLKAGKDGLEPTGTDAIYELHKGTSKKVFTDKERTHPNGLAVDNTGIWVVTSGTGELYHVGKDGKKGQVQKLPSGSLDGVVKLSDGSLLVSSWGASAVYRGTPGGTFAPIIPDVKSPADIGYDTKRDVVLIPMMQMDRVTLQKLPGGTPEPAAKDAPPEPVSPPGATSGPAPSAKATEPTKGARVAAHAL